MDLGESLRRREEEIGLLLDMDGSAVPGCFAINTRAGIRHIGGKGRAVSKYRSR